MRTRRSCHGHRIIMFISLRTLLWSRYAITICRKQITTLTRIVLPVEHSHSCYWTKAGLSIWWHKTEFPTREYFAKVIVKCFQQAGVNVMHWCCSKENHKHGGIHYNAAIKLNKICRWSGCKRVLKQQCGITVNFSSHHRNYYSAWCYVTKTEA